MSVAAVQQVVVRMLFDPAFVEAVYADPSAVLTPEGLDAHEQAWLVKPDRRLYGADALRPRRTLKGLLEEYKGSGALLVSATRRLASLDGFFSSPIFHDGIRTGCSLALSFGDYLIATRDTLDPRIAAVACIEQALAKARRSSAPTNRAAPADPNRRYVLSPHIALCRTPGGALEVLQAVEQVLFEISLAPVAALADDGPNLANVPALAGDDALYIALAATDGNVVLEPCAPGLFGLLERARQPLTGGELVAEAPEGMLQRLCEDRLIILSP